MERMKPMKRIEAGKNPLNRLNPLTIW